MLNKYARNSFITVKLQTFFDWFYKLCLRLKEYNKHSEIIIYIYEDFFSFLFKNMIPNNYYISKENILKFIDFGFNIIQENQIALGNLDFNRQDVVFRIIHLVNFLYSFGKIIMNSYLIYLSKLKGFLDEFDKNFNHKNILIKFFNNFLANTMVMVDHEFSSKIVIIKIFY